MQTSTQIGTSTAHLSVIDYFSCHSFVSYSTNKSSNAPTPHPSNLHCLLDKFSRCRRSTKADKPFLYKKIDHVHCNVFDIEKKTLTFKTLFNSGTEVALAYSFDCNSCIFFNTL